MACENLPTINAVSDTQRSYAEDVRKNRLNSVLENSNYVLDRIEEKRQSGDLTNDEADQVRKIFNSLHQCTGADFWLNYFDTDSEIGIFTHCVAIAALLYGWENPESKSALCGPVYRRKFGVILSLYKQFREEMSLDEIKQ